MKIYDLSLSEHDVNVIMSALGELTVKVAINTVNSILSQKAAKDSEKGDGVGDDAPSQAYKENIDV